MVSFGKGIAFKVVLHQVWKKHPVHLNYLGFYVLDSDKMSTKSQGLLGMEWSSFRLFRAEGKAMCKAILATPWPAHSTPLIPCLNLEGQWPCYLGRWQGLTV